MWVTHVQMEWHEQKHRVGENQEGLVWLEQREWEGEHWEIKT